MGYNGSYLEDLLTEGNNKMIKSLMNKSKEVKRRLMNQERLDYYFEDHLEEAKHELKRIDNKHFRGASKHSKGDTASILDHYFAVDDVLEDVVNNIFIGIDWALDRSTLIKKITKHNKFSGIYTILGIDKVVVCYVINEDCITPNKEAKFIFNTLKYIVKEVYKPSFQGGLTINAKDMIS